MPKVGKQGSDSAEGRSNGPIEQLQWPGGTESWLKRLGSTKPEQSAEFLRNLSESGLPDDLFGSLLSQIAVYFARQGGIDRAIENLAKFFEQSRSPLALATLFDRDSEALPILLRVISIDGSLAQIVLADAESFDLLRAAQGRSVSFEALLTDLRSEVAAVEGERGAIFTLRQFHGREVLRIGYGLLVGESDAQQVTEQLSNLAEVLCRVAAEACDRSFSGRVDGGVIQDRLTIIGVGDCGSGMMHFESPLDLVFLFDESTNRGEVLAGIQEKTERIASFVASTLGGPEHRPYQVEVSRMECIESIRAAISSEQAFRTLDTFGRTWQRLELLSARTVGGSATVGNEWLAKLGPWLYRRRLADADIDGLLFQYRKWRMAISEGALADLIRGIRILQLTLAGDHPDVRQRNPLNAITPLNGAGAIAARDVEPLKKSLSELNRRMLLGQLGAAPQVDGEWMVYFLRARTIIGDALARIFGDAPPPPPAADLVMNPRPGVEEINAALVPFGLENPIEAGASLTQLAQESSPFLSTRKSRHFLAMIAPALLKAISKTPSPDQTLSVLSRVVDSLGAKGALWELFLANPPSMELCVRICAYSPYLSNILIASPGFIDELLDSLQLARLPSLAAMESRLDDLCRGAEIEQAIHEFKNALHLRIGVRDILGKEDITTTHRSLAQAAEAIVRRVAMEQDKELVLKHGIPFVDASSDRECRHVLLVSGKLGALEPNYQSEVEFAVIYEGDGMTRPQSRGMAAVSCAHFFGQLAQRSLRKLTTRGTLGQLFSVNNELRPLGAQGPLAVSLDALRHHYLDAPRPWRELLWLCKARPAGGDAGLAADLDIVLHEVMANAAIRAPNVAEFRDYRIAQTVRANPLNLKRAPGGTQHIELLVQFLQLAYSHQFPRVLAPGTLDAISRLATEQLLTPDEERVLGSRYRFLRTLESRIRLMNTLARHDLPENDAELRTLAMFVGAESGEALRDECIASLREVEDVIRAREERLANELPD